MDIWERGRMHARESDDTILFLFFWFDFLRIIEHGVWAMGEADVCQYLGG